MGDPLEDARDVLVRADEQLKALDEARRAYLADKPYRVIGKFEPQSLQYVARVYIDKSPPRPLRTLISEMAHSLRVSLDYLAYTLATPKGGGDPPLGTEFPIFNRTSNYHAIDKKKGGPAKGSGLYKVRGMDGPVQAAIESLQPYHRMSDPDGHELWMLHEIDIIAKHRKRHVTGTLLEGASMNIQTLDGFDLDIAHVGPLRPGPFVDGTPIASIGLKPTKANAVMEMNFDVTFDVAFDPVGPARGEPVAICLTRLRDFVRDGVFPKLEVFV